MANGEGQIKELAYALDSSKHHMLYNIIHNSHYKLRQLDWNAYPS